MSAGNPTTKERLAALETALTALDKYVRNDLAHRLLRVEVALYVLVLGGFAALGAYVLEQVGG